MDINITAIIETINMVNICALLCTNNLSFCGHML